MDVTKIRRMCLEYAVRNKCYKTFDALYSKETKTDVEEICLTLFAIRRAIYNNDIEKFPVAMNILHRIYLSRDKGLRNQLKVYFRLICHMKMDHFSRAIQLECRNEMFQELQSVMSGKHMILEEDEDESNKDKAQQMMWGFYRLAMPITHCTASEMEYLSDLSECIYTTSSEHLTKLMDKFTSQILETLPTCDLDLMINKISGQDASLASTKFERVLQNILEDKHSLTDEKLLQLFEQTKRQDENNNEIFCTDLKETEYQSALNQDMTKKKQFELASLYWDKESMDDMRSVVAPSVSENFSNVQLSDLEETEMIFKDNDFERTPDLSAFLKTAAPK